MIQKAKEDVIEVIELRFGKILPEIIRLLIQFAGLRAREYS